MLSPVAELMAVTDHTNDDQPDDDGLSGERERTAFHPAMLLMESLLHLLIERAVISIEEGIEVVQVAIDVTSESTIDLGSAGAEDQTALAALLGSLERSRADRDLH